MDLWGTLQEERRASAVGHRDTDQLSSPTKQRVNKSEKNISIQSVEVTGSDLKSKAAASKNTTDSKNSVQNKHRPVKTSIGQ